MRIASWQCRVAAILVLQWCCCVAVSQGKGLAVCHRQCLIDCLACFLSLLHELLEYNAI